MSSLISILNYNMQIGKSIQALRKIKGLSQLQVAKMLAVSQQAYSKLEKQEWVEYDKVEKILSLLNSSRRELEAINKFTPPPRKKNNIKINFAAPSSLSGIG